MNRFFTLLTSLIIITATAQAQDTNSSNKTSKGIFSRKATIKELTKERDSLYRVIDSLMLSIESFQQDALEMPDSLSVDDSVSYGLLDEIRNSFTEDGTIMDTDSLLSIYYHGRGQENSDDQEMVLNIPDSVSFTSTTPDSVYINRLNKMCSFIPIQYNTHVKNQIIFYTKKHRSIDKILGLCTYYMPEIEEILSQYNLPLELKAMAVIESALNPRITSRAGAKGMWQFMYRTAKDYGLTINSFVDERMDPVKSCHSAAKYLRDSYLVYGDWLLAIASYNCGLGNVNKAIRRSGGYKDFWTIYPYLPRETRGYVPAFIAALYVMQYYQEENITPVKIQMPVQTDTIMIHKMLHLEQVSQCIGIPIQEVRDLNPQYVHDIIPGTERDYILRLPFNYTSKFVDKESEIYSYKDSIFFNPVTIKKIKESGSASSERIVHKVKKGETLGHIAAKYRVSVNNLKRWNGLKNNTIRIGQRIVIYRNGYSPVSQSSTSSASSSKPKTTTSGGYLYYTIRKGDNLWDISKKFPGTTANSIMKLNGFTSKTKLYPGDKIKIKAN